MSTEPQSCFPYREVSWDKVVYMYASYALVKCPMTGVLWEKEDEHGPQNKGVAVSGSYKLKTEEQVDNVGQPV